MSNSECHPTHSVHLIPMVSSCTLVPDALQVMRQARASYVLITQSDRLVGIFTERDLVKTVAAQTEIESLDLSAWTTRQVITMSEQDAADLGQVLQKFRRYRIRHLPIVNSQGEVVGVATPENIRQVLQPSDLLRMRRVSEMMEPKVVCAPEVTSIADLALLMAEKRVSCVVIVGSEEGWELPKMPIGIVTERDIVKFKILGLDVMQTVAAQVMSAPLFPVRSTDTLWSANQAMQEQQVRRLVVLGAAGELVGLITQSSVLAAYDPAELASVIQALRHQETKAERLEQEKAGLIQTILELRQQLEQPDQRTETSQQILIVLKNIQMATQMLEIILRHNGCLHSRSTRIQPYLELLERECTQGMKWVQDWMD